MNKDESGLDARFIRKNGISSRSFCKPVMIRISYLCRAMNLFKLPLTGKRKKKFSADILRKTLPLVSFILCGSVDRFYP